MKRFCVIGFAWILAACTGFLSATNIEITDVKFVDKDNPLLFGDGHVYIHFSLSWDRSWKDKYHENWDAAWIFCKARTDMDLNWRHVWLDAPDGPAKQADPDVPAFIPEPHRILESANVPTWFELATSITENGEKYVGCFVYKKNAGYEDMNIEGIELGWWYIDQGFTVDDELQIIVFGIEMVYIPDHPYVIGDGYCTNSLFVDETTKDITTKTFKGSNINNMGKIYDETGYKYKGTPIPDAYPMGIKPFYIMKYEISQHGYVDFLNTLTYAQQVSRVDCGPAQEVGWLAMSGQPRRVATAIGQNVVPYRNYVRVRVPGTAANPKTGSPALAATYGHNRTNYGNSKPPRLDPAYWVMEHNGGNIACNFLSWDDGLAFLDWACLRPITEMEFEKVCRGPRFMRGEFAWGNSAGEALTHPTGTYFISADYPDEEPNNPGRFYNYLAIGKEPYTMRCGAFAGDTTSRYQAGAAYYGVGNMSDCLWDRCVNVSTAEGRSFVPVDGDGKLDENGNADVTVNPAVPGSAKAWPTMEGGGFRGYQTSNRQYAESIRVTSLYRDPSYGFRGARYAPSTNFNPF